MPRKFRHTKGFKMSLIAPCGMNCRLCYAYTREKNPCPGCRGDDSTKPKTRVECRIKNCSQFEKKGVTYCFQCDNFPCKWLIHLDNRYRTKYRMSMIDNLKMLKYSGVRKFIESEKERWACSECGGILCVHKPNCPHCGA